MYYFKILTHFVSLVREDSK